MPTPMRTLRLSDEEWRRVVDEAEQRGTTASAVIREALGEYLQNGNRDQ